MGVEGSWSPPRGAAGVSKESSAGLPGLLVKWLDLVQRWNQKLRGCAAPQVQVLSISGHNWFWGHSGITPGRPWALWVVPGIELGAVLCKASAFLAGCTIFPGPWGVFKNLAPIGSPEPHPGAQSWEQILSITEFGLRVGNKDLGEQGQGQARGSF